MLIGRTSPYDVFTSLFQGDVRGARTVGVLVWDVHSLVIFARITVSREGLSKPAERFSGGVFENLVGFGVDPQDFRGEVESAVGAYLSGFPQLLPITLDVPLSLLLNC